MPRPLGIIVAALAVVATAGCASDSEPTDALSPAALAGVGKVEIPTAELRSTLPPGATDQMRKAFAGSLIAFEWIRQEARREGIRVAPVAGRRGVERFNALNTQTVALTQKLLARIGGPPPSNQDVTRYYRTHPLQYGSPRLWVMKRMPMSTRSEGLAAKRALDRGGTWNAVFRRYADMTTHLPPPRGRIGEVSNAAAAGLVKALSTAPRGEFTGPVRARYESASVGPKIRWYVFMLLGERDLPGQSLDQSREAIIALLRDRQAQHARGILHRRLDARYRPETRCSKRLLVSECVNGPRGRMLGLGFLER